MRCFGDGDPLYERYHDEEWGRPVAEENALFERITLEAFQSGLAWITILRKREGFRAAFHRFDPERVARMGEEDVEKLLNDRSIVRNRAKIRATIANARALSALHAEGNSLSEILWSYARPASVAPRDFSEVPAHSEEARLLSKRLKSLGFRFLGPTTAYATLQAVGVVNDHLGGCRVRRAVERDRDDFFAGRPRGRSSSSNPFFGS